MYDKLKSQPFIVIGWTPWIKKRLNIWDELKGRVVWKIFTVVYKMPPYLLIYYKISFSSILLLLLLNSVLRIFQEVQENWARGLGGSDIELRFNLAKLRYGISIIMLPFQSHLSKDKLELVYWVCPLLYDVYTAEKTSIYSKKNFIKEKQISRHFFIL